MDQKHASPWMMADRAIDYLTDSAVTKQGRRKMSKRRLVKEVNAGRLRAARIGGRGELMFRREWLDEWVEQQAAPVMVRRRA